MKKRSTLLAFLIMVTVAIGFRSCGKEMIYGKEEIQRHEGR